MKYEKYAFYKKRTNEIEVEGASGHGGFGGDKLQKFNGDLNGVNFYSKEEAENRLSDLIERQDEMGDGFSIYWYDSDTKAYDLSLLKITVEEL